ncbi:MAG: flippase [Nitrospirota bacterium]
MTNTKRLLSNYAMLSSVQAAKYILPLLTVPYLVRVLGPAKFGLIAFSQAFIQYFILITDYGFNYSATRNISIYRDDMEKVSEIFSSVMLIKTALMLMGFAVVCVVVFSIGRFRSDWPLYLLTFGSVAGNVLFPIWLFQGMEKMKHAATLDIILKTLFTASIFLFIKKADDYIYVPLINSAGGVLVGFASLWIIFNNTGVKLRLPSRESVAGELREGWMTFISTVSVSFYTATSTFILGILTNNTIVGYYSAGEKIARAAQYGLLAPLSQTIYPHISRLAEKSREDGLLFLKKIRRIIWIPTFFASLALFIFAPWVGGFVLGEKFNESIPVIRILAFLPFITGMATVYAHFFLLGFGYSRLLPRITISAGLLSLFGIFLLVHVLGLNQIGASINVVMTEVTVLALSFRAYSKLTSPARLKLQAMEVY